MKFLRKRIIVVLIICLLSLAYACNKSIQEEKHQEITKIEQAKVAKQEQGTKNSLEELPTVTLAPATIYPGDFFTISVANLAGGSDITISSQLINTSDFFSLENKSLAIIGVNYRTSPGKYPLKIKISRNNRLLLEDVPEINILQKKFPTQYLKVTAQQKAKRNNNKWKEDAKLIAIAKSVTSSIPLWKGKFLQPVAGRISTEFGVIRYINNVESGRHSGLDIAAPRGTPIVATNSGIITLAKPLNVTGNTIIINHGLNIFSAYAHLDKILVKNGQFVRKGEIIGKVGSTGFSTGPHLHWTISVGTVFVNPWEFIKADPFNKDQP